MADAEKTKKNDEGAVNEFDQTVKGVSLGLDAWRRLKKNRMAMAGLVVVAVYALLAITAPLLPIYSFREQVIEHQNLPPSLTKTAGEMMIEKELELVAAAMEREDRDEMTDFEAGYLEEMREQVATEVRSVHGEEQKIHERRYILGTDDLGRDMLARIIYGSQVSIAIGLVGAIFSMFIGVVIGALAGYIGGSVDYFIMRVVDIMYGLPYMLLVIILMAIFGNNVINLFIALSLVRTRSAGSCS